MIKKFAYYSGLSEKAVEQNNLDVSTSYFWKELLREKGAKVDYNDPYISRTHKQRRHDLRMVSKKLSAKMLAGYDIVLISTDHTDYDYEWIVRNAKLVVDTRNATKAVRGAGKKVVKA